MKTLARLCDDNRNPIEDTPFFTLEVDTTSFRNPDGYFKHEGSKYLYYGTIYVLEYGVLRLSYGV